MRTVPRDAIEDAFGVARQETATFPAQAVSVENQIGPDDIEDIIGADISYGDYAETEVVMLFRLKPGRGAWYGSLEASCDTTGWDCQAGGIVRIGETMADVVRWGLSEDGRETLGIANPE